MLQSLEKSYSIYIKAKRRVESRAHGAYENVRNGSEFRSGVTHLNKGVLKCDTFSCLRVQQLMKLNENKTV